MASRPRIYTTLPLAVGADLELDASASNHLIKALRLGQGDEIRLFNGDGCEYLASIELAHKKSAQITLRSRLSDDARVSFPLHLGQVISKGERMEFTIQKATELGVTEITPLFSERCEVRLKGERLEKKMDYWRNIAISACEQSGRNSLPVIHPPCHYDEWAAKVEAEEKLLLHPHQQQPLGDKPRPHSVALLIGPEGGFSEAEVEQCLNLGFSGLTLGPRVLRTETAALAAISVLQYVWGDF